MGNALDGGKPATPTQKSDGKKIIRKAKVDMGEDPADMLSESFIESCEDEEISPFKMLREVCQTRQNLQNHAIAAIHLKEGLHYHFKGMTDEKLEFKPLRQDDDGLVPKFSKASNMDEPGYGYALVMMGMVLTPGFSDMVTSLLKKKFKKLDYTYTIMRAPCKSFSRMFNKVKTDHADAKTPRYAQNIDVVRMGVVFDEPEGLSTAAKLLMKGMEVIRTKNQFVLKEGDSRGGYKACIMTMRYVDPNNNTFGKMAENNKEKWARYIEDSKERHKNYARKAVKWLSSRGLAKKEVAMACEVQLMYKPYYFYRKNVHFLYKVLRTENLEQFLRDFAPKTDEAVKKNKAANKRRASWAKGRNTRHSVRLIGATHRSDSIDDDNTHFPELSATHNPASDSAPASATMVPIDEGHKAIEDVHLPTI